MHRRVCAAVAAFRAAAVLAAISVAVLALCATPAFATPPYVTESLLTPSLPSDQQAPSLTTWHELWETDIAVFEDDRNGDWDIYARDLWSPNERRATTDTADQRHPSASGSWVAYEDDRHGNLEIYLVNLTTLAETRLTTSTAPQQDPAVTGDWQTTGTRVVWEDQRNGNWDIYLYDAGTQMTKRLTTSTASQIDPAIDGTRVVWADRRNGDWDIYLYDTVRKTTTRLTRDSADQRAPAISGTMVVYQDRRNGNWDIYGYDLATKKERRITRNAADQTLPAVSPRRQGTPDTPGWRVAYQDARNAASAGADIYLSDIPAGGEFRLTDNAADQLAPSLWGYQVAYADLRDAPLAEPQSDVYLADLVAPYLGGAVEPAVVAYNGSVTLGGYLVDQMDTGLAAARVFRYVRVGADDQATRASTVTDASGSYDLTLTGVKQNARYRVVYKGDASHLPAVSKVLTVQAQAWLSTPSIPREFGYNKTVTVSGTIKPRHTAGTYPIKFEFYRYYRAVGEIAPSWHLAKTLKAKAANYSTYTRCSVRTSFPKPAGLTERWRVHAVHKDGSHALSVSPYRTFTVDRTILVSPVPIVP